jgi:hypothetical protein
VSTRLTKKLATECRVVESTGAIRGAPLEALRGAASTTSA